MTNLAVPGISAPAHLKVAWPAGLLCLFTAAACAGDAGESTPTTPTTSAGRPAAITITLDEYRFSPAVLTADDADLVRAQNDGGLEHSWSVLAEPIGTEAELAGATVLAEARVEVGQTTDVDISSLAAGRYQVVCVIPGHFSAGMFGELIVGGG